MDTEDIRDDEEKPGDELEDELLDEMAEANEPKALESIKDIEHHITAALHIDGCAHWLVGQYLTRGLRAWGNDRGAWKDWMREKWGFGYRQAHRYINIYHQFPEGPPTAEQAIEAMREQQGRSTDKAEPEHLVLSGPEMPSELQAKLVTLLGHDADRLTGRTLKEIDRLAALYPETGWPVYCRIKLKDLIRSLQEVVDAQENSGWREHKPTGNGAKPSVTLDLVVDAVKPLYPKNHHKRIEKLASQLDLGAMSLEEAILQMLAVMSEEQ